MPATKTESAEAVRGAFVAVRHFSCSYVWACLHRVGTPGFGPSTNWVVTVAVPLADSAVPSVDEELRMLVAETLAVAVNRLALGSVDLGLAVRPRVSRPTRHRGDHMLATAFGHFTFSMLPTGHAYQPIGSIA
jgi:hypothetical protein